MSKSNIQKFIDTEDFVILHLVDDKSFEIYSEKTGQRVIIDINQLMSLLAKMVYQWNDADARSYIGQWLKTK